MKKIVSLLTMMIFVSGIGSLMIKAAPNTVSGLSNNHDKMVRDSTLEAQFQNTTNMLQNKDFVLEADYLANKYGDRMPVTSSLNFISVKDSSSVLQIGRNTGIGYNGVGGVTTTGTVSNYKVNIDKKRKSFYVAFSVMSPLGSYDINMSVGADGYARATLTGISGGQLIYTGYLVPTEKSSVYKGYNTY